MAIFPGSLLHVFLIILWFQIVRIRIVWVGWLGVVRVLDIGARPAGRVNFLVRCNAVCTAIGFRRLGGVKLFSAFDADLMWFGHELLASILSFWLYYADYLLFPSGFLNRKQTIV
ncbi:hypothetical protein AV656_07765 [Bhargavaea cecembensis]|uniref:Uncharacterized protein n=1 Tax=Bhargavaea cecembensis TaxID=394098 RepID=A0A161ST42_9BACL|nr:hypothetical protein AV656_07765 [Bhargavaea cecembensis]